MRRSAAWKWLALCLALLALAALAALVRDATVGATAGGVGVEAGR